MQHCRVTYCTLRYVLYITLNLAVCVGLWTVGFCGIFGILVWWYGGLSSSGSSEIWVSEIYTSP